MATLSLHAHGVAPVALAWERYADPAPGARGGPTSGWRLPRLAALGRCWGAGGKRSHGALVHMGTPDPAGGHRSAATRGGRDRDGPRGAAAPTDADDGAMPTFRHEEFEGATSSGELEGDPGILHVAVLASVDEDVLARQPRPVLRQPLGHGVEGAARGRRAQPAVPGRDCRRRTPEWPGRCGLAVRAADDGAGTPPDLVDAHVEDEWSLAQTLRHLILATDAGSSTGSCGCAAVPRDRSDLRRCREMGFDMSIFRVDQPAYEEILAVRAERQRLVTDFLATATASWSRRNARTLSRRTGVQRVTALRGTWTRVRPARRSTRTQADPDVHGHPNSQRSDARRRRPNVADRA